MKKVIGLAADHGGFPLKQQIADWVRQTGMEVKDFGAHTLDPADDYPDFVVPLARAVASGEVDRGIAVCGSGVGAAIAVNKVPGIRGCLITEIYSAKQGVEHDDMNLMCLGGRVIGPALAHELVMAFLPAEFTGEERHRRRLAKVSSLEHADKS